MYVHTHTDSIHTHTIANHVSVVNIYDCTVQTVLIPLSHMK